jgi:hypothetical protein
MRIFYCHYYVSPSARFAPRRPTASSELAKENSDSVAMIVPAAEQIAHRLPVRYPALLQFES